MRIRRIIASACVEVGPGHFIAHKLDDGTIVSVAMNSKDNPVALPTYRDEEDYIKNAKKKGATEKQVKEIQAMYKAAFEVMRGEIG